MSKRKDLKKPLLDEKNPNLQNDITIEVNENNNNIKLLKLKKEKKQEEIQVQDDEKEEEDIKITEEKAKEIYKKYKVTNFTCGITGLTPILSSGVFFVAAAINFFNSQAQGHSKSNSYALLSTTIASNLVLLTDTIFDWDEVKFNCGKKNNLSKTSEIIKSVAMIGFCALGMVKIANQSIAEDDVYKGGDLNLATLVGDFGLNLINITAQCCHNKIQLKKLKTLNKDLARELEKLEENSNDNPNSSTSRPIVSSINCMGGICHIL